MRVVGAVAVLLVAIAVSAQAPTDFTGHWQMPTSSGAQRRLVVEQKGQELRVSTVVTDAKGTRNLEVKYEIGGPETSYKGLDGDEFRTSVHWNGNSLVFDTIEREDGKEIPQKATWTLSADGNALQVDRQTVKSGKTPQSLNTFAREP